MRVIHRLRLLLPLALAAAAHAQSWNVSVTAEEIDSGLNPSEAEVGGTVAYNSNGPGLGTGNGGSVILDSPQGTLGETTTYSYPATTGVTSATAQIASSNNNNGNPWCASGGCISGTVMGSASATGNLATGSVGLTALSSFLGDLVGSEAYATAEIVDTLTFNVAGATNSTVTYIGVQFTISGSISPNTILAAGVSGAASIRQ
jgi:hypothetical protein